MTLSLFTGISDLPLTLAWVPGAAEWILIAAFGLLLFGKRLPEVGRSLGKGIVEFKKGLKGVEEEVEEAVNRPSPQLQHKYDPQTGQPIGALPAGAKFDPYTGKPIEQAPVDPGINAEPGKAV